MFQNAASKGHAGAQSILGSFYEHGEGVPKDRVLAYAWLNLAAVNLNDIEVKKQRDAIEAQLTVEELAEAQALSSSWSIGEVLSRSNK